MIQVEHLTKKYAGRTAVDDVSLEVGRGEVVGFLGPNGAGKSTTMKIITSYLPATSGQVRVAGFDVFTESIKARQQIGYMPENVPLYEDMRVNEYLHFRAKLKGVSSKEVRLRVSEVMSLCGVEDVKKKMISSLSKGYRQRVGLADALVHRPALLILDEPTNGLDPNQIRQVREIIKHLGEKHTILLSTHILTEVEATCQRVIILDKGRVKASDTPEALQHKLRSAGQIEVELKAPNEGLVIEAFKQVSGVRRVQTEPAPLEGWMRFIIRVEGTADPRAEIAALAVSRGWPLQELLRRQATLEDIFVEITQH